MLSFDRLFVSIGLVFSIHFHGAAQTTSLAEAGLLEIHQLAGIKADADHQLLNGIYYENPYFDATSQPFVIRNGIQFANPDYRENWHPFLNEGDFHESTIHYRNSRYEHVLMKYDIFHQQLIINPDKSDPMLMTLLSNEFVSEFWMGEAHFRKFTTEEDGYIYYQVISEEEHVKCYREWYKIRYKVADEGDVIKYKFSERKSRDFLEIGGQLSRFNNNRTMIQLIPDNIKDLVKGYLKSERIKVNKADIDTMKKVVQKIETILST